MIANGADIPSPRAISSSLPPPASSLRQTGGSVVFVQLDQQTIADYPVGGAATTPTFRYVYASYIDEPVVRKGPTSTSTTHFYHRNQQYSVSAVTTSTGAVAERYAYSAYGQPTILNASGAAIGSSTINNRYTYTGREWDSTVGLYHFRARWMSPSAGRFLSRDPMGFDGGSLNIHEYCHSKPFIYIDPTGMQLLPSPPLPVTPLPPVVPLPSPPQVMCILACTYVFHEGGQRCVRPVFTRVCYWLCPSDLDAEPDDDPEWGDVCCVYQHQLDDHIDRWSTVCHYSIRNPTSECCDESRPGFDLIDIYAGRCGPDGH